MRLSLSELSQPHLWHLRHQSGCPVDVEYAVILIINPCAVDTSLSTNHHTLVSVQVTVLLPDVSMALSR